MTTTLIFTRRGIESHFLSVINGIVEGEIIIYSDEKISKNGFWWKDHLYKKQLIDSETEKLLETYQSEIRNRCRFLRLLTSEKANILIREAAASWITVINKHQINNVITLPIDSYVLHTLYILCDYKAIPILNIVGTPFDNRLRFTKYGELLGRTKDKNIDEITLLFIEKAKTISVKPNWLIGMDKSYKKTAFKRLIIDNIKPFWFLAYRLLYKDHDSFSFSRKKHLSKRMFCTLKNYNAALKTETNSIKELPSDFIFLPLQFYPESTSDYWIKESDLHNHHLTVLSVVNVLSKKTTIIIKEHPAAFARRNSYFLESLQSIPNVYFSPLQASVFELLNNCSLVLGQASTTTFQAQILGKKVLFFGKPYFSILNNSKYISSLDADKIIDYYNFLKRASSPSETDIFNMVKEFLLSTAEGSLSGYKPLLEKRVSSTQSFSSKSLKNLYQDILANDHLS